MNAKDFPGKHLCILKGLYISDHAANLHNRGNTFNRRRVISERVPFCVLGSVVHFLVSLEAAIQLQH